MSEITCEPDPQKENKPLSQNFKKEKPSKLNSDQTQTKSDQKVKEEEKVPHKDKSEGNDDPLSSMESFIDSMGPTWKETMKDWIAKENHTFKFLYKYVVKEYKAETCFPPKNQIFNAFQSAEFDKIKVVIVGQDPYIQPG